MVDLRPRLQAALGDAYAIDRELGGGGMSRVFLATEASLHRQVVIKVLPPELASEVSEARFKQEIELAAHLQHTNILPVLTAGARDELLFYVMPFVSGESLRHRLTREGKLPVADAVRVLHEIADALAYAHAEGVIHRDIKPENILLLGSHAVLTDFGVARALAEARSGERLTETGMSVGTPGYMSPEQAAGERHVDARADVYALAVVGYEMLAGVPPFEGPTAQAVLAAHLTKTPKPLVETRAEVPAAVSAAIAKALEKVPAKRLHTAAELRDALGGGLTSGGSPAVARRSRLRPIAVAVVLAVAAGAFFLLRSRSAVPLDANLVAVAPFDVLDPKLELWKEGLVDVLSRNLDGAGPLRTVSPTVVVRRWSGRADPASATALGRKVGAGIVVFGGLVSAGQDSVRLTAALLDVASGNLLAEVEFRDAAARVDRMGDSLTIGVLRELGKSRPVGAVRLTSIGSTSLPAIKMFLRAEQFYRRAEYDSALVYAREAVALDSNFTLALRRIPQALWWSGDTTVTTSLLREGAHNHGLAPRESLLVAGDSLMGALDRGDTARWRLLRRLSATLDEAVRRYPDDPEIWYLRGELGMHYSGSAVVATTPEQTLEAFQRAVALDSAFAPAYTHAVELSLLLDDPVTARRYAAAQLALGPIPTMATGLRLVENLLDPARVGSVEVARTLDTLGGDALWEAWERLVMWPDSAEASLRLARLFTAPRHGYRLLDSSTMSWVLPSTLAYRGHLREAYRVLPGMRNPVFRSSLLVKLALLGAVPHDSAAAQFGRWLRTDNGWAGGAAGWWAQVGDTASLHELAHRTDARIRSAPNEFVRMIVRYQAAAVAPYLALARHDTASALLGFATLPDSLCPICLLERWQVARLLAAQGRNEEAARMLDGPIHAPEYVDPVQVVWALERGRVNERLGNRDKAIAAYRYVANVWRNADPELQRLVEEAKAALARLRGEGR